MGVAGLGAALTLLGVGLLVAIKRGGAARTAEIGPEETPAEIAARIRLGLRLPEVA